MKLKSLVLAAAAALAVPLAALAGPVSLSVSPSSSGPINVGDSVTLTVSISGLQPGQNVGSFNLHLNYNTSFLSAGAVNYLAGNYFGMATGDDYGFTDSSSAGRAGGDDGSYLSDLDLQGLQGNGFDLFTVTFTALAGGAGQTALLDFDASVYNGSQVGDGVVCALGQACLARPNISGATISINGDLQPPGDVPEPGTYALVLAALAASAGATRRRNR